MKRDAWKRGYENPSGVFVRFTDPDGLEHLCAANRVGKRRAVSRAVSGLEQATKALDSMDAAGWDPFEAKHQAQRRKSAYEHAQRKYHNQGQHQNMVRVPTKVLSNLINMDDHLDLRGKWSLASIASELDGDQRHGVPGITADTIVVPAPLVIDLLDAFERAVDDLVKQAIDRDAIHPEHGGRFESAIKRETEARKQLSCAPSIEDGMRDLERQLRDTTPVKLTDEQMPEFLRAIKPYSEIRIPDDGNRWEASVAVTDCSNWRFRAGPFAWIPKLVKVEHYLERHHGSTWGAITVGVTDTAKGPDVYAMLEEALGEDRAVHVELQRYDSDFGNWYWGDKARIKRIRGTSDGFLLTLYDHMAYFAHGSLSKVERTMLQFRRAECGHARLSGALPTF